MIVVILLVKSFMSNSLLVMTLINILQ